MKYFSTFSGIGGFELGIGPKHECVGFSEVDRYAIEIYQKQFPNHKNYGDITKIKEKELPDFDLFVGGFPCQSFSVAGKRKGFRDTRGTLFFDIARIIKAKRPRFLCLENVKGLLSHDEGRTFSVIICTLDELGYDVQWQVLNSKDFGVPQNRERVIIVGHLRGESRPEIFPITRSDEACDAKSSSNAIDANYFKGIDNHGQRTHIGTLRTYKDGQGFREVKSGLCPTIPARAREDGSGQPIIIARNQRGEVREMEISGSLTKSKSSKQFSYLLQRSRGKNKGGKHSIAPTLTGKSYQDNNHVSGIRRLTPVECERLQGFPDGWTEGVSDTQRYKCLGNAVTTKVIQAVMEKLL